MGKDRLREHDSILFLSGVAELSDVVMNALFETGCDDATPSRRSGRVFLTFVREASSLEEAILWAICDVIGTGIRAEILRVDACKLVPQADIARRIPRTRQQVGQYVSGKRGPSGFPATVCFLT